AFLARGIPGFGWRTFRVSPDAVSSGREQDAPPPARAEGTTLDNGQLVVNVDADDGTLSLRTADGVTITGANRLVDGGDGGEPFLRIHTEIDNRARDHRLRAHVPLPKPVTGSDAECAFGVVRRGLTAEGGPHEAGLPTFVSRRFVDCSNGDEGVALLHDGLL